LGPIPNPQSPNPKPQTPISILLNLISFIKYFYF
jgi:hypothetical protein